MKKRLIFTLSLSCMLLFGAYGQTKKEQQVLHTMKIATRYMMDVVSYQGGFVWNYLPDLSRTWGEMEAKRTMVWVQPPGTPAVGHLMLDAYHATHDEYYYQCAERIANALIWGQLPCGGWNYMFDFAGENSIKQWYATIGKNAWRLEEFQHYYGNATFDDGGTMQAAKFLLRLYVEKYNPTYRMPLEKTIRFVLESQYPIGGWPQRYPLKHNHPFHDKADYSSFITLNDDVIPENIDFLIQCYQTLGMQDLKAPIMRALNCVLILQQGAPYAGWADQYTGSELQPAHARSYEPRSINTATTAHAVMKLLDYYRLTGDTKFLSGIPAAIRFLESMELPEAEAKKWKQSVRENSILMPRFIDPENGKPLYVHRKGSNVANGMYYIDQNIENTIGHYNSAAYINIGSLKEAYERTLALSKEEVIKGSPFMQDACIPLDKFYYQPRSRSSKDMSAEVLVKSLTKDGYWLTPIKHVSHFYKPAPKMSTSDDTQYAETMVGDEYDTSPYIPREEVMGVSTGAFIENMTVLIHALQK